MIFSFLFWFWQISSTHFSIWQHPVYFSAGAVRADSIYPADREDRPPPEKTDPLSLGPEISARSAVVVDKDSGAVLYSKNENEVLPLASITKLLSALVFLQGSPNLAQTHFVQASDERPGAIRDPLRPGDSATLLSFLTASLQASSNSATAALARAVAGSEDEFVRQMKEKARQINMQNSNFSEPTGLSADNRGTAFDIARLLASASQFAIIPEITSRSKSVISVWRCRGTPVPLADCPPALRVLEKRNIINTDHLVYSFVKIIMGKTGYLDEALYNLASEAQLSNGRRVFIVTLGSATSGERFQDQKNLAYWAEKTYSWEE